MATIPQIFIGGVLVGGCTDIFEAWGSGRAQPMLEANGVSYRGDVEITGTRVPAGVAAATVARFAATFATLILAKGTLPFAYYPLHFHALP